MVNLRRVDLQTGHYLNDNTRKTGAQAGYYVNDYFNMLEQMPIEQ